MKPNEYFPNLYMSDMRLYMDKREIIGNGPQWMLCGRTMIRILESPTREQYNSLEDFLVVLYELNLINQGIHAHFYSDFHTWNLMSIPFPDCQECVSHHGFISTPGSILRFVRNPSFYLRQAKPVKLDIGILREYTYFFFQHYLKTIVDSADFISVTPEKLIERLRDDKGCSEFRKFSPV